MKRLLWPMIGPCLVAATAGLWLGDAIAQTDPQSLTPSCAAPFKFKADRKVCDLTTDELKEVKEEVCSGSFLEWKTASKTCAAKSTARPDPECKDPKANVIGLKIKDGKCVIEINTVEKAKAELFTDSEWAAGIAVLRPKEPMITDASIVDGKVRVNASVKQESSILIARHFYPWNQKRSCLEGSQRLDEQSEDFLSMKRAGSFVSNCVGMMVGIGMPTSNATSGQVINFFGVGLTVGGGVRNNQLLNWHFGIGWGRKFNLRVLGDGFVDGQPPPGTETQIRYKTKDVDAPFTYFTIRW